ncbi:hypothetical protein QJS04_geneDACA010235 [Acorus gramineus]|uniref:Phytocyanin domain-containing protein n=1 Tax=Acorus gramineus TaxID=55184 RepID=A0AAV9A5G2_ACOGR|nr:hypothetical protein QJS04_geneDACA010235 [Acorus gramineus]
MASVARSMASLLLFVAVLGGSMGFSAGAVYKVGDSQGWTTLGNPNYTAWAVSKTFHVGDVVVFEYHKEFHNVLQVTRQAYRTCDASAPLATFNSGNDSIPIKTPGHHYFLCGIPTHCTLGQKVDIRIPKSSSASAPSLTPSLPGGGGAPTEPSAAAPSPKANGASTLHSMRSPGVVVVVGQFLMLVLWMCLG